MSGGRSHGRRQSSAGHSQLMSLLTLLVLQCTPHTRWEQLTTVQVCLTMPQAALQEARGA